MAKSQAEIFSYPEVVCLVLNNSKRGYCLPSFHSFDSLFLKQEMENTVSALSPEGGSHDGARGKRPTLYLLLNSGKVRLYYRRSGSPEELGLCQLLLYL